MVPRKEHETPATWLARSLISLMKLKLLPTHYYEYNWRRVQEVRHTAFGVFSPGFEPRYIRAVVMWLTYYIDIKTTKTGTCVTFTGETIATCTFKSCIRDNLTTRKVASTNYIVLSLHINYCSYVAKTMCLPLPLVLTWRI